MEITIQQLTDILIECGINKNKIHSLSDTLIEFGYKKITHTVEIDGEELIWGPDEFDNGALNSDYLHDNFTEYGGISEFEDYISSIVTNGTFNELYSLTEKLYKLEIWAEENEIDFESIVTHMFRY
jgi:hypothetical protein